MKLALAKGVRDVFPAEKIVLDRLTRLLEDTFARYGFAPLDTPVIERYDVLASKYAGGAEILKEIFRLTDQGGRDLCLRYDFTVPFARFVGMNPQLKLPFKRYQIGKVFRDGPVSTGRLREFTQCDVDIVGAKNPLIDAEILALAQDVYTQLGLAVEIRVNDRFLLNGLVSIFSYKNLSDTQRDSVILILDKLDKVGKKSVCDELVSQELFTFDEADLLLSRLETFVAQARQGDSVSVLREFRSFLEQEATSRKRDFSVAREGLDYLDALFSYLVSMDVSFATFNPTLSRGLSYYTGVVFEAWMADGKYSLGGGGRYDAMIGNFLGTGVVYPASGISFGLERIALAIGDSLSCKTLTEVFVLPIGDTVSAAAALTSKLRVAGVRCEMDLIGKGVSKNLDYASKLGIPFVLFVGARELESGELKMKKMVSGEETFVSKKTLVSGVKSLLRKA